ncbi:restriction endonuclease [Leptolyngbya sp. FACHB-17]|nr:restriction endonuclease [Leptolyngbya sp. FACHB-17]
MDDRAFFPITDKQFGSIIFQVKSGKVDARNIRDLAGTMSREKADLGIFITLKPPTQPMIKEAKAAGHYHYQFFDRDVPKIQIVTVEDIVHEKAALNVPLVAGVLKSAPRSKDDGDVQLEILAG